MAASVLSHFHLITRRSAQVHPADGNRYSPEGEDDNDLHPGLDPGFVEGTC